MKTASLPAVRVTPDLRAQIEQALHEGESLSAFVEASVVDGVKRRLDQADFIRRGMASLAVAKVSGNTVSAEEVLRSLDARIAAARAARATPGR